MNSLGAALERTLQALEADGVLTASFVESARVQFQDSMQVGIDLLRKQQQQPGELRGSVQAYNCVCGNNVLELRDAELDIPGFGTVKSPSAIVATSEISRESNQR